jgi:anti-sigma factor RsiW
VTTDPAACVPFDADLSALLDGELGPAREAELRAHVAGCARCADHLARLARADEALRALPSADVPADLATRLRARIEAEDRARPEERGRSSQRGRSLDVRGAAPPRRATPRRRRWIPLAAGAFATAAALALYLFVARPRLEDSRVAEQEEPAPEREVATREIPPEPPVEEALPGPELEAIQAASDEELAFALDLDTLADLDVIERLDVLEQLAALDGSG